MTIWLHNDTSRSLTLKAAHLDTGCWLTYPTQQHVAPGERVTWTATGGNCGLDTRGYVTYTVDGTGNQSYAYFQWHYPDPIELHWQAGAFTTLDRLPDQGGQTHFSLRCAPRCF
ncbi:hypothetical protein [Actinomadura nitritigenes]|uniref:hypothetical protein n=1 Tax=Actinomadura nitritigenes TaxID=134602 RepID=UPI003D8FD0E8